MLVFAIKKNHICHKSSKKRLCLILPTGVELPTVKSIRRRQAIRGDMSCEVICQVVPKEVYLTEEKESDTGFILQKDILLVT